MALANSVEKWLSSIESVVVVEETGRLSCHL
jgi:hypothetical protein